MRLYRGLVLVVALFASSSAMAAITGTGPYTIDCSGAGQTVDVTLGTGATAVVSFKMGGSFCTGASFSSFTANSRCTNTSPGQDCTTDTTGDEYMRGTKSGVTDQINFTRAAPPPPPSPVPTLSEWAMITFTLLLAGLGLRLQRRRQG